MKDDWLPVAAFAVTGTGTLAVATPLEPDCALTVSLLAAVAWPLAELAAAAASVIALGAVTVSLPALTLLAAGARTAGAVTTKVAADPFEANAVISAAAVTAALVALELDALNDCCDAADSEPVADETVAPRGTIATGPPVLKSCG